VNNSQRRIVLIASIIVALLFFFSAWDSYNHGWGIRFGPLLRGLIGPVISLGIGIAVWAGRDKTEKPPDWLIRLIGWVSRDKTEKPPDPE